MPPYKKQYFMLKKLLGSNPITTILGYLQLLIAIVYEAFQAVTPGEDIDWVTLAGSVFFAIFSRYSADSKKVKAVESKVDKNSAAIATKI